MTHSPLAGDTFFFFNININSIFLFLFQFSFIFTLFSFWYFLVLLDLFFFPPVCIQKHSLYIKVYFLGCHICTFFFFNLPSATHQESQISLLLWTVRVYVVFNFYDSRINRIIYHTMTSAYQNGNSHSR